MAKQTDDTKKAPKKPETGSKGGSTAPKTGGTKGGSTKGGDKKTTKK